tara:strand:- start:700 stop:915 length:216 start_codon:yes stop_codon:yes gene_type:complete
MSVEKIGLEWGNFYNGELYRNVALKGCVSRYWHDIINCPISSLTRVAASHTFTTVNVTQRINNRDNGGHYG